jgi:hypothetical protein
MFPRARKDNLTIRELPEETLVYDQEQNKAHCLNAVATLIWRHCDGRTSTDELARLVAEERGIDSAAEVVSLALEQLGRRRLLEEPPAPLPAKARIGRRDALKKIAFAAAALPMIMTIATRTAAQSMSGGGSSDGSTPTKPPVNVNVNVNVSLPVKQPSTPACRTKGQSCVAASSGQKGNCCAGLSCTGVFQNAGVCG